MAVYTEGKYPRSLTVYDAEKRGGNCMVCNKPVEKGQAYEDMSLWGRTHFPECAIIRHKKNIEDDEMCIVEIEKWKEKVKANVEV